MAGNAAAPAQDPPKPDAAAEAAAAAQKVTDDAKAAADAAAAQKATDDAKAKADADAAAAAAKVTEQGKETPGKDGEKPKAPEKYTLTVPENGQLYVDDQVQAQIETMARKAGWTNEEAQAALNEHVTNMTALSETFLATTKADTEYGGDKLAETQRLAKAAIDKVRPAGHPRRESFLKFLNRFGGSNHLDSVSFLADVGRMMAEDSPGSGNAARGAAQTAEQKLYDKTPAAS
jgi:hypothetical protein